MAETKATSPLNKDLSDAYMSALKDIRGNAQSYSVLDYPDYNNIGDSAIWVGQRTALRKVFGKGPSYVASQKDYRSDLEKFCRNGIIFIQGGGNFGDTWPLHQHFRIKVIREYRHRKIVQLSQSLSFSTSESIEETKTAIGAHKDFHLFARDQASFDFASKEFDCNVFVAPDAAHCIPRYASVAPQHEVLSLIRTDKESLIDGLSDILSPYGPTQDWEGLNDFFYKDLDALGRLFRRHLQYKFSSSALMMSYRARLYDRFAQKAVDKGTRLLSLGDRVISDRLHAHILCLVMGKKHLSIDNTNGKIGEYIRKWGDFGITDLVDSRDSLVSAVQKFGKPSSDAP